LQAGFYVNWDEFYVKTLYLKTFRAVEVKKNNIWEFKYFCQKHDKSFAV